MWWSPDEEALQLQAVAAGGVPPAAPLAEEAIAAEGPLVFPWHIPEDPPEAGLMDFQPVTNGVHGNYEGDLVAKLEAAWAAFGQSPDDYA
jgi:hypothetical protein